MVEKLPPPVFRLIQTVLLDIGAVETREVRRERERGMMVVVGFMTMVEEVGLWEGGTEKLVGFGLTAATKLKKRWMCSWIEDIRTKKKKYIFRRSSSFPLYTTTYPPTAPSFPIHPTYLPHSQPQPHQHSLLHSHSPCSALQYIKDQDQKSPPSKRSGAVRTVPTP